MRRLCAGLFCLFLINGGFLRAEERLEEKLSVPEIVDIVLKNNPAVEAADADISAADASVKSARADMLPAAEFSYGYTSLMDPPVMKIGDGEMQVSHQKMYNWDLTVVQPLFSGFALDSKLRISKLDVAAKKLEKEQVLLDLIRSTKSACYRLLLSHRLLAVGEDEVAALEAHRRNAELFYQQGIIRKNDLLRAEVALANSRQQLETAGAEVQKAEILLNRLMNRPLKGAVNIDDGSVKPEAFMPFDLMTLETNALKNRPLIRLLNVGIEQLDLTRKLAKSAWYPKVALVGRYEQDGDDPMGSNNDYSNDHNASISAQLQWKFWLGGKTRADMENARMQLRSLKAGIERYRQQILEEVRGAVLDCDVARGNMETAESALEQAKENWRITELQYREQTALASDVLDARAFLSQADGNYYRAFYGYMNAVAALERAVAEKGGR